MTTHELANILLKQEDVPVVYRFLDYDHNDNYYYADMSVNEVHFFNDTVYLVAGDFVSPEEEERRQEEERLFWEEERRKEMEAEAKLPTLKNALKLVSDEAKDAFVLYIDNSCDLERILTNVQEDPSLLGYRLRSFCSTNARLTKEHVLEIMNACVQIGIAIPDKQFDLLKEQDFSQFQKDMFKSETDKRYMEALRNQRKTNNQ
jgi:hypothetical protein